MPRTIQEISFYLKECFSTNETIREIYSLDSTKTFDEQFSKVSIESKLIDVFSSSAWLLEQLWESFRVETEQRVNDAYVTSLNWYYRKALEFQKGDSLAFDSKTYSYKYPVSDVSKQVIKNVAIRQVTDDGVTKLKVYFSDASKQQITGDTRSSFETYMKEIGAAGTHYLFISEQPDTIRVHLHIYYDPLVLDSSGTRLSGNGKPVEETIENYLNNLEYGGVFYTSKLMDMIQITEGVRDVTVDGTTWKGAQEIRRKIDSDSGAFIYEKNQGDIIYSID